MNRKITELQPSQLYLSEKKLEVIKNWLKSLESFKEPILVRRFSNSEKLVIVDGHTRAFAALQLGMTEIPVAFDEEELSENLTDLYETCVNWCQTENISTVKDLAHKILASEDYEINWIQRCQEELTRISK